MMKLKPLGVSLTLQRPRAGVAVEWLGRMVPGLLLHHPLDRGRTVFEEWGEDVLAGEQLSMQLKADFLPSTFECLGYNET